MLDLLNKFVKKQATERDLELLQDLCDMVKSTSLCGLGMSAPNPVLTTLRYFQHEYQELLLKDEPDNNGHPVQKAASEVSA
jgi:bidirectional [NiFe] hydrogenase diaphorase subunit